MKKNIKDFDFDFSDMNDVDFEYIAKLVEEGYLSGELYISSGDDEMVRGSWKIAIIFDDPEDFDDLDENSSFHSMDETREEIARLIKDGFTSGFEPTFTLSINK